MGVRPGLPLSLNSFLKILLPTLHIQTVTKGVGTAMLSGSQRTDRVPLRRQSAGVTAPLTILPESLMVHIWGDCPL